MVSSRKPRVLIVTAIPMTVRVFLLRYIVGLAERYDVTVACSGGDPRLLAELPSAVRLKPVDIRRNVAFLLDLKALWRLVVFMRSENFDLIHSVTPKAGLLAQLAGRLCGVTIRLHTFTGQVWATQRGFKRKLLKGCDQLLATCATHLLADSVSQKQFLIMERVVGAQKISVIGKGSIAGVDPARFYPDIDTRRVVRKQLGILDADVVALYVGRLTRDKGVLDLVDAFSQVCDELPDLILLLVGPDEEGLGASLERVVGYGSRLRMIGATSRPEKFMVAADFLCLPSYREGFGTVVIEAAACGLPSMASAIYGLTDAIDDGFSGVLHPPRDVDAIAKLLVGFSMQKDWRERLGRQARQRVTDNFSAEVVTRAQIRYVQKLLG